MAVNHVEHWNPSGSVRHTVHEAGAPTDIFIITGKKGLGGRGRWLLLAGTAIPMLYLLLKT